MAIMTALTSPQSPSDERKLNAFGLSTELIHTALRPGTSRATNRTALALASSPGTDIYHDTMEQFALNLFDAGWRVVLVEKQPRLLHPDGLIAFTLASGTNVANPDRRKKPRTRRKGKATRESLSGPRAAVTLFDMAEIEQPKELVAAATKAPLWLLVHERTDRGLNLEFSRPSHMTEGDIVNDWDDRILIAFLDLDGDLSMFDAPDDGGIDVSVVPLR
jgi:hypothetical protein